MGHALGGAPGEPPVPPAAEQPAVQIIAAMVNPPGPAPEQETVSLMNLSPEAVDLAGWQLADRQQHTMPVPAGPLAPGEVLKVLLLSAGKVSGGMQLSNHGGAITFVGPGRAEVTGGALPPETRPRGGVA